MTHDIAFIVYLSFCKKNWEILRKRKITINFHGQRKTNGRYLKSLERRKSIKRKAGDTQEKKNNEENSRKKWTGNSTSAVETEANLLGDIREVSL